MAYSKTGIDPDYEDPTKSGPQSEADVIKAAMSGKAQIIGGPDHGFVDAATRPKSSGGSSILGGVDNFVSNVGGQITEAVKPSIDTTQLIPNLQQMPNPDQDFTKISVRGLQESAVEQAGDAQNALIDIGTAVQEQVVQSGKVGQEAVVKLGADAQEQAVKSATQISGGQSNATLEGYANQITKGTESQINQGTKYVEEKVMPVVVDAAKFLTENRPDVKILQGTVKSFESLTPSIEMMGSFDLAGGGSVQDTSDPNFGDSQLSADPTNLGDEQVFGDLEKATGKDSKLTEEERLRRIRRLLLNRYGRENTILTTGPGDTRSRRRYAI